MTRGQRTERPGGANGARWSWVTRVVAIPLVLVLTSGVAWAYWTAGSEAGGKGASAVATVNRGATPTASSAGNTVTVSWAASTLSNGTTAVAGYLVKRYDGALTSQTILTACDGTVAATTCTENSVPVGTWTYSVTPVFATSWRGAESLPSSAVTVAPSDATPPVNAITMSVGTGGAFKSGDKIFYRGSVAGSFTLTNAVSDSGSGPASSATASLTGTTAGWTHAASTVATPPGGPYVANLFSWTSATGTLGEVVTGRDVAGNTATTTLSFVNDSTAPTSDTITYSNTYQAGRSVAVTFTTTGTDSGSGIATRQLQRASAPLTGVSCGNFGSFANLGAANPTSPYTDSLVTNGVCYQYRYVVTDRVGNQAIATSTNISKVDYAGAVSTTTGLLSQWRLGESAATLTSSDSFTATAGTLVANHTGQIPIGATWVKATSTDNSDETISDANRAYRNGAGYSFNYTTATPPNADYSVAADLVVKSILPLDKSPVTGDSPGVVGRSTGTGAGTTGYMARWEQATTSWNIIQFTNITATYLSSVTVPTLTPGQTYRLRLEMSGTTTTVLTLYVNGVLMTSYTDTTAPLTATGRAGIRDGIPGSTVIKRVDTGIHYDNFQVTAATYPRAADSKGSNTADYLAGPTLGVPGAIPGDANTAAQFDGVNEYVQAVGTTGIPVGATARSVEMWFKTSSAARQVLFNYGTRANDSEFGLLLNAGGTAMTAWGYGPGDRTFTLPYAVNNGLWHQVVKSFSGTSITLYIDGVALPAQTATRATVMDPYGFGIGAVIVPGDNNSGGYFNGSLDEVSFYTTTLGQATVTNHYELGTLLGADVTGPTGGSVDATGLVGTGPRYAASTTLNLSFSKGTDPSGVAATGARLWRATAPLTSTGGADGVCGTFGGFTLVTGGADSSPKSDTVADQACYQYQYVVADTLGNPATYTSSDIKVDTTAPAAPFLVFSALTNTYWSVTAPGVVYRSAAATGSFTATAAATDTGSGIAGYTFPALSTGTSTPGPLGVNTYSWTVSPATGTKNVTATNNATGISSNSPFTLTADTTAPTPGTVAYLDATTTGTTVSVGFTTGADGGSGVGTRLLQRQSATLTGTTCGSFGAFSTVTNGTNPTSPLVDTVSGGNCYRYQYVVSDNVGNQGAAATSTSVAKVASPLSYLATIIGETSLVNYWRLGEATTSDSFTGPSGATLQSHTGETGATWTKHDVSRDDAVITNAGRIRKNGTDWWALYSNSTTLASADYTVEANVYVASAVENDAIGIVGRLGLTRASTTFYAAGYDQVARKWTLGSVVNNVKTVIGTPAAQTLTQGTTYRLALDLNGSTIRLLVDGVERVSATDNAIQIAGRGGITVGIGMVDTTLSDTTGMQLDSFKVTPALADSKGTNHGNYLNGPTLGVTGGITGDANTAAQFDGVNDYGTVARQISDDFSIEFWFKSTQGLGVNNTSWRQGAGLVDAEVNGTANDFGVSLGSDGKVVAGVGGSPDVSIVSPAGHDDGAWHHVVFTRTRTSGALQLFVDGVSAGSATGSTASLTSPANINFGRIQAGNNYFSGSLDEVATYSRALSQPAVTAHYNAAK